MFVFPNLRNKKTRDDSSRKSDIKESNFTYEILSKEMISRVYDDEKESADPVMLDVYPRKNKDADAKSTKNDARGNQYRKKSRLSSELRLLTRDDYRISKNVDINNPSTVQLFAADFANTEASLDAPRPKRRLKAVSRYEASGRSYNEEKELQKLQGKIGTGFLCPECHAHLGYDLKMCWNCGLECYYSAGIGVVVCKDRSEVMRSDTISSKQVVAPMKNKAVMESKSKQSFNTQTIKKTHKQFAVMIKSSETEECEACMQLFLPTYLQRHRRRCHQLSTEVFGCPYCSNKIFHSMIERSCHIHKSHPGLPTELDPTDKAKTKLYLYDCPKCTESKTYGDLRDHLLVEHDEDIVNVVNTLTCTCPFCLVSSRPVRRTYHNMDGFLLHVKTDHPGCSLMGVRLNIGAKRKSAPVHVKSLKRVRESEVRQETYHENADVISTSEAISFSPKINWDSLVVRNLDLSEMERIPVSTSVSPTDLLTQVMNKIKRVEQRLIKEKREVDTDDGMYLAEQRLYIKCLRERTNKAESEALEKATYKQKCDEIQRLVEYENRNRKRSLAEIEYEELLRRPIQFVNSISRTRNDACAIGDSCDICRYDLAHQLMTATEIKAAGGDIKVAIKNFTSGHQSKLIPCLRFKRIDVSDLPDDRHENGNPSKSSDKADQSSVVTRRGSGSDEVQLWKLYELKHTLEFMIRFNNGLLTSK